MTPQIAKHADDQQEGFIKGRQALNNIVTVDCHSRVLDSIAAASPQLQISQTPLLLLFDFAAAFPSLAHAFIFLALRAYNVPEGMYLFFVALYTDNKCYAVLGGVKRFLYNIFSGILQGCPASGSLFVLAIDPLLRMFKAKLEDGRTKAVADDLAMMLPKLIQIQTAWECFERFHSITGLALKPKKCKLIPLGARTTPERCKEVESYVVEQVPDRRDFEVTDSSEYLGFRVGHAGGTLASWAKPLVKYEQRAAELSGSGVSASAGTATYNVKVATITSYVEQL